MRTSKQSQFGTLTVFLISSISIRLEDTNFSFRMTDVNESEKSVTDQPPTSESQPTTAIDAIDNTSSETTAAPDHSEHTRKSSKVETSREIVSKSNEEARKTSSSSLKSAHRLNSSSKSSIQHPERSETLQPARKKTKKSITLPMPMLQETQQQNEPPLTSARSSISTTATTLSDSPRPMKYASIDLENEIPEIFSSSLNPAIQDPDMSEFYSRPTPFYQMKTPPPLYSNRKGMRSKNR
ncbi:hypothetical protein DICVIV_10883 [Dictyocaulus viviparus]|uniref:Uncharacterized protein n=1 Tax=Dictyocaulus viviparus TaxID=29172 RepID=A0A0D8XET6_DICVI|nr:hypothetical protein DICVIV_10883 [Dictyocaulus viviparus]